MSTLIKVIMIFAVAALIGIAGAENAPPNFPVGLQGSVSIGGNPAPQGTAIYAKVGNTVVGVTEVQTAGVYGDKASNILPVAPPNDGTTVDLYVNDVKVTPTFTYYLNDAKDGKIFRVDLNAPGPQGTTPTPQGTTPTPQGTTTGQGGGPSGGGGGDGGYGGGGTTYKKGTATPTVTATGAPKEALPGAEGTPMPSAVTPIPPEGVSNLPIILGATAVLVIGGIIVLLKKLGKI